MLKSLLENVGLDDIVAIVAIALIGTGIAGLFGIYWALVAIGTILFALAVWRL